MSNFAKQMLPNTPPPLFRRLYQKLCDAIPVLSILSPNFLCYHDWKMVIYVVCLSYFSEIYNKIHKKDSHKPFEEN